MQQLQQQLNLFWQLIIIILIITQQKQNKHKEASSSPPDSTYSHSTTTTLPQLLLYDISLTVLGIWLKKQKTQKHTKKYNTHFLTTLFTFLTLVSNHIYIQILLSTICAYLHTNLITYLPPPSLIYWITKNVVFCFCFFESITQTLKEQHQRAMYSALWPAAELYTKLYFTPPYTAPNKVHFCQ